MDLDAIPAVEIAVGIAAVWVAIGGVSLLASDQARLIHRVLFPASAAVSFVLAVLALAALRAPAQTLVLPLGLPELPFHIRLDPLASLFLFLLGICSLGISIYAGSYF